VVRGKSYSATVRLCQIAADRWPEIVATYYQTTLLREPLWKFIALVYSWCIERVDPEKLDEWLVDLNDLLEWQSADSEAAEELESQSFFAMQQKSQGNGGRA
jgi:hypothetical protein